MMNIIPWRIAPLLILTLLVFFFWRGLSLNPHDLPSAQLGKPVPRFSVPILGDEAHTFTSQHLKGHISLLNIWASWCNACTDEQYFLLQLANDGVPIYGLNYKDNVEHAKHWLEEWGNPYRLVGEDTHGMAAIDMGVYGAPETFLIDKEGIIRYRHVGGVNADVWQRDFLPLIKQLEQAG